MNLAIPGFARTGTTSMWRMFRDHPQISTSIEKEYIIDHKNIVEGFKKTDNTKLCFDGSPNLGLLPYKLKLLDNKEFEKVFCIFVLRDIKDRLLSTSTVFTRTYLRGNNRYPFPALESGELNINKLHQMFLRHSLEFDFLKKVEKYTGKDRILIVKLNEVENKQDKIQDFLELDYYKLQLRHLNTVNEHPPTIKMLLIKQQIIDYLDKNGHKYYKITDEQRNKMRERYKIL